MDYTPLKKGNAVVEDQGKQDSLGKAQDKEVSY